jgi:hypothetical protein
MRVRAADDLSEWELRFPVLEHGEPLGRKAAPVFPPGRVREHPIGHINQECQRPFSVMRLEDHVQESDQLIRGEISYHGYLASPLVMGSSVVPRT